jgi:tetratricopeptide (TPR) repeat protein
MAATAAIRLKTAAEVKGKAATVAATVAQKALNAAANANPYVLLASALIAVGTAIYKFTQKSNEAERQQEEFNKKQEEARELNSKLANSIGSVIAEYNLLKREYTQINSLADKQQWIEENASAFEDLGLNINSVNDADKIFVEQSNAVINALKARAKAEALTEKYKEAVINAEEEKLNVKKVYPSKSYSFASNPAFKGPKEFEPYYTKTVVSTRPQMSGVWEQKTDAASQAAIESIVQQNYDKAIAAIDATVTYWENLLTTAEKDALLAEAEIKGLVKTPSTKTSKTSGSSSTSSSSDVDVPEVFNEKSLKYAQQKVSELQDALSRMATDSPDFESTLNTLREWEGVVATIQDMMKKPEMKDYHIDSLKYWQEEVKYLQDELSKMDPNSQAFEELAICLLEAQDNIEAIQDKMKLEVKVDPAIEELERFERKYETTMSNVDTWSSVVRSVADSFGSIVNALNDENTALGALGATLTDNEKAWLNWGVSSMSTVAQVLPQIASLVLASQAQSLAQGTASAAALPFPANLAAIASVVAMIVSIFASLPKFAAGGIISGSSHIGDMNLARVNGGEMILNTRQQANLFNMLDKNRLPQSPISSGEVTFRIQGDTLVGVIDNYNRKRSRI